jgi:hypothetical protein
MKWTDIIFLESSDNLKPRIKSITGREPSSSITREVSLCLQQGRLFYQSATDSPLQIKPLLLYYGTMAFAKALNIALNNTPISSLPQSHGITDISSQKCMLTDLTVKIQSKGTFQTFNSIACKLNRVDYIDSETMMQSFSAPTELSENLVNIQISLKEILSRIPGLETLYKKTFNELPNIVGINLKAEMSNKNAWEILITTEEIFRDRESLKNIVSELRETFPILEKLNIISAKPVWNASYIDFSNLPIPDDEFAETNLLSREKGFETKDFNSRDESLPYAQFTNLMKSHVGSFSDDRHLISPYNNLYLSKMSLHYLGIFLLSSLVRYRPQIWGNTISRSIIDNSKSNDYMLSILEEFMKLHVEEMTKYVIEAFETNNGL